MQANRWTILAVLFLARVSLGFQFQSIASVSSLLVEELSLSYAQVGTLIGLFMAPGIFFAIPGGFLGARFGDKRICALGLLLMALGGLVAGSGRSYELVFAGRLVSGVGVVLLNVVMTKMVTEWFAGREIIAGMGVFLGSWPGGIALGLVTQSVVAGAYSWPVVMYLTTAAAALGLVLVLIFYRNPPTLAAKPTGGPLLWALPGRELLPVCLAGLAWGVFNVGFAIFFSFTPALLVDRGSSPLDAGSLVSLGLWVSLVSVPLGGYLTQRLGWANAMICVFSLLGGVALFLFPYVPLPALFSILVGIGVGPSAGAIVALPSRALSPENRGPGLGIFYVWYYLAMTLGPVVAGWGRDLTGSPATPVLIGGVMFCATIVFSVLFHWYLARSRATVAAEA